jgi:glycosyltransferase involved in cell wall biosynthesis
MPEPPSVAFVSNFAAHYRVGMFEALARMCDLRCYFYSNGGEWYWQQAHGVTRGGHFAYEYLPGFWLGRIRIAPRLLTSLRARRRHQVFVKCINDKFALPATWLASRRARVPFILWTGIWQRLATPLQRLIFPLTRWLYLHSDAIVVYGEHVRRYLISEGVDPRRIFIAPQAVDNAFYRQALPAADKQALLGKLAIPDGVKTVLYLGRLEPVKGIEYLLAAFAMVQEQGAVLVLCGTGSLEAALRKQTAELGIEASVRFAGYVPPPGAVAYYSIAWTVVLPSITMPAGRETWGLVVNEAFNQASPMITTDAVGAAAGGLLVHERNGLVVPEQNPDALAQALRRMLDEPGLRDRLGRQGYEDVAGWTHERMAEGFRDAIQFVLGERRK